MSKRTLIAFEKLPVREKTLDREQADKDIREALAKVERRLYDKASQYSVGGYTWGEPEFAHAGNGTVGGSLVLERPD